MLSTKKQLNVYYTTVYSHRSNWIVISIIFVFLRLDLQIKSFLLVYFTNIRTCVNVSRVNNFLYKISLDYHNFCLFALLESLGALRCILVSAIRLGLKILMRKKFECGIKMKSSFSNVIFLSVSTYN